MHVSFDPENFTGSRRFASQMTDEEFYEFCSENDLYRIEREADGTIVMEPPVHFDTDKYEIELVYALKVWNESQTVKEGIVSGPSAGFKLPNGATRAADASWISMKRYLKVPLEDRRKFLPQCPEFVVEIRSHSDRIRNLQSKMAEWIANGALLGWLIDPVEEKAYIYWKDGSNGQVDSFEEKLMGEDVLPGFVFDLKSLKLPW
jgi:Uma2 family endonuclease